MKFQYYPDTDSLYIDLTDKPSVESEEISPGVVLDFDADGNLTGIDIDHASKSINLTRVEINSLPVSSVSLVQA